MTSVPESYRLVDRYESDQGRVFMTSIQALARIPAEQLRIDRAAGHHTAALLSGYPGSPLGGFDLEVSRMLRSFPDLPIIHRPAVNEELAASAIMGSQLAASRPDASYDGVLGIWYGKAPGLDRATDALRHGVFAGTSPLGGAIALVGDDPAAKSSTMPSSSDAALVDLHMPILYPGITSECLELGLHAVAISRASGLWAAMKIVTPVADGSESVDLPVLSNPPIFEPVERSSPSAMFLGSARMIAAEKEFRTVRAEAAYRYGVQNQLNRIAVSGHDDWIGIAATGYTYYELRESLRRLGFNDDAALTSGGIRLLHLRMPVPFDADLIRTFATGISELLVVEEKNPTLEWLVKDALYDLTDRPRVFGKQHLDGRELMPSHGLLDADRILAGLREHLARRLESRMAPLPTSRTSIPLAVNRTPFFCSGCPHNWGTKVPEGALVGAGTGCHGMSLLMPEDLVGESFGITAMGNEGAHWIGMEPFVETDHVFQNFGDGTYFHSGQVAVQAAIGAGVSITFKILYNDTVAMTGGQEASFRVGVPKLVEILLIQGVKKVVITAPDAKSYDRSGLPRGVEVWNRDRIVEVQNRLAEIEGVTVLINDQACAAELRRARRRNLIPTPKTRIVINHRICEGCGDCGDKSNCLSVQPFETAFGRKTRIDQASCNLDYSCIEGDCPAFMEVDIGDTAVHDRLAPPPSPDPTVQAPSGAFPIRLAGIGGTGVVTAAQILATASMFDGWTVEGLDQTGLSQKAGPVVSDVVLTGPGVESVNLIGDGEALTLVAFDQLVGAAEAIRHVCDPTKTTVFSATGQVPTGAMIGRPEIPFPAANAVARLSEVALGLTLVDSAGLCGSLVGDSAPANILMLGVAVQSGHIPVTPESVMRAIRLNGVAVENNLAAFGWGRSWGVDPDAVESAAELRVTATGAMITTGEISGELRSRVVSLNLNDAVSANVETMAGDLSLYQDVKYAGRFFDSLDTIAGAVVTFDERDQIVEAAARSLHKLMAYKDEYEVARLMLLPEATGAVGAFGGDLRSLRYLLHPPALKAMGRAEKIRFSQRSVPMFRTLAAMKRFRGTAFDVFGRSEMRTLERDLVTEFEEAITIVASHLRPETADQVLAILGLPDMVRGFEDLKLKRATTYRTKLSESLQALI